MDNFGSGTDLSSLLILLLLLLLFFFFFFFLGRPLQKAQGSVISDPIGMKSGTIIRGRFRT